MLTSMEHNSNKLNSQDTYSQPQFAKMRFYKNLNFVYLFFIVASLRTVTSWSDQISNYVCEIFSSVTN